jgi:hypothetical protein
MTHRLGTIFLTVLAFTATAGAAEPPTFDDDETLGAYLREYGTWAEANFEEVQRQANEESFPDLVGAAAQTADAIPKAVDTGSSAVERDALASFSSRFELGIDSIEAGDEEGSFVVKLNETRLPFGSLGLSAIVRQASPSEELLQAAPETDRKAIEGGIESRLGDLDDLTYSLRWGLERSSGPWRVGRRFELYQPVLERELAREVERLQKSMPEELVRLHSTCEIRVTKALGGDNWEAFTREDLVRLLGEEGLEDCLQAARWRQQHVVALDLNLNPLHLLGFLVDNQPQLVATLLVHDRDPLAGREGWEVKLEYEHGLCNLNKVLGSGGCGDGKPGLAFEELQDLEGPGNELATKAQKGHKLTFSLRYAERDEVDLDRTFGTGDSAVGLDLLLPEATEKSGKLQYSRNATWQPIKIDGETVFPKLHVSAEYTDVSDDPDLEDRLVAQLTYEIPLTASATLPLSLSYANHAEFLGDVDDEFSAHLGLTYSIKTKKKENGDG